MKILVTGGSGRIGTHVIEVLEASGYEVVDYDMIPPRAGKCKFIKGNLTDLKALDAATKGIDAVIHLAAYYCEEAASDYPSMWDVNVTGTFNVLEASVRKEVKKIIYASSICATGLLTWVTPNHGIKYLPVDEEHPCEPQNLYGMGKLIGEKLGWMYASRADLSFTALRIATVWFKDPDGGPAKGWKDWELIEKYVRNPEAVFKLPSSVWPNTMDLAWQYVGVEDVAEAFKLALEKKGVKFAVYNIGAANTCSDWDSIKIAKTFYAGVPLRDPFVSLVDTKRSLYDISKAQKELGYTPRCDWKEFFK